MQEARTYLLGRKVGLAAAMAARPRRVASLENILSGENDFGNRESDVEVRMSDRKRELGGDRTEC